MEIASGSVYISFPGPLPSALESEDGVRFYEDFVEIYGEEPDPFAVYSYQSMLVILDSIERAGVADRAAILEAMRATTDFEGLSATFSFDENGDATLSGFFGYFVGEDGYTDETLITPTMHETCEVE